MHHQQPTAHHPSASHFSVSTNNAGAIPYQVPPHFFSNSGSSPSVAPPANFNNAPSGVPNLYIIALPNDFTTEQLVEVFSQFGEIESARLMVSREVPLMPNRSFGFVLFKTVQSAMDAVARGHGMNVGGSTIQVYVARPKAQTSNKPSVYTANEGFRAPPPARRITAQQPSQHNMQHVAQPMASYGAMPQQPFVFNPSAGASEQHHHPAAPGFMHPQQRGGAHGAGSIMPQHHHQLPAPAPTQYVMAQLPNGQTAMVPLLLSTPLPPMQQQQPPPAFAPSSHAMMMGAVPQGATSAASNSSSSMPPSAAPSPSAPRPSFAAASIMAPLATSYHQAFATGSGSATAAASSVNAAPNSLLFATPSAVSDGVPK